MLSELPFGLIVEDDPQVRSLLCRLLVSEDFTISAASSFQDAKQIVKEQKPSLVLLDLGLPGGSGLELGRWIRSVVPDIGIIILTGWGGVEQRVKGLACADDYVVKPFDLEEVRARVRSLMRRLGRPASKKPDDNPDIVFEDWLLSADSCALLRQNRQIRLSLMEFRLLKALTERPGKIASRSWLLGQINADIDSGERVVDYHICTLRIKLRKAGLREDVITSVRGLGYKYARMADGSV